MTEEIYVEAGKRLAEVRNMRGYSRDLTAMLAEITPKYLYEVEYGRKGFSGNVLYKLCKALDVDCHFILTGEKKEGIDKELAAVIALFPEEDSAYLAKILKEIYNFKYKKTKKMQNKENEEKLDSKEELINELSAQISAKQKAHRLKKKKEKSV